MKQLIGSLLSVLFLSACSTPKNVAYFEGVDNLTAKELSDMHQTYNTSIMPGDLLNITVSAWDPNVVTPFNPPAFASAKEGEQPTAATESLYNYQVDKNGKIKFPVIGEVKAGGLTREELSDLLESEISKYVKDPLVSVQITNFKVTVIGEVAKPGTLNVTSDRISILDAIGQAGDLTINANRTNVLVVREENGEKKFGRIDLTETETFASPYYYLRQNDIVYVEPNDAKKRNYRYSQAQQYNVTFFSTILSAISVITSMVVTLVSLKK